MKDHLCNIMLSPQGSGLKSLLNIVCGIVYLFSPLTLITGHKIQTIITHVSHYTTSSARVVWLPLLADTLPASSAASQLDCPAFSEIP